MQNGVAVMNVAKGSLFLVVLSVVEVSLLGILSVAKVSNKNGKNMAEIF